MNTEAEYMDEGTPRMNDQQKKIFGFAAFVVIGVVILAYLNNTADPLQGKGPEIEEILSQEKGRCENRVKDLQAAGIDGAVKYEGAQLAANGFVGYLQGVLDQGTGNKEEIKDKLVKFTRASEAFCTWADDELKQRNIGANNEPDLGKIVIDFLRLVDEQEQARRKVVRDNLEKCKFRSWRHIEAKR